MNRNMTTTWYLGVITFATIFSCVYSGVRTRTKNDVIPNSFLVTLHASIIQTTTQLGEFADYLQKEHKVQVVRKYPILKMLHIHAKTDGSTLNKIRDLPQVERLSPNTLTYATADVACEANPNPRTWGLDRIDQRIGLSDPSTDPPSSTYGYNAASGNGEGTYAYVLDTGIEISHPEFGGRAVWGFTASELGEGNTDGSGHGTHIAGIIGGADYGVAKSVNLIAVKVLNSVGAGPASSVVGGLEWALADFNAKTSAAGGVAPVAVINLALSGSTDEIGNAAQACINAGIHVVFSAGDSFANDCLNSPAGLLEGIRVGAVQIDDVAASFSNWGLCVAVYAPGVSIVSAYLNGVTASLTGTSMASAHVSGVVARYGSMLPDAPAPAFMKDWLEVKYTPDVLTFQEGQEPSHNRLLFVDCEVPNAVIP